MARFSSLPAELRLKIYEMTLEPEPGVCTFSLYDFLRRSPMYGDPGKRAHGNAVWQVPKPRFPAIARLCHESRVLAQRYLQQVCSGDEDEYYTIHATIPDPAGLPYCVGRATRALDPDMDTLYVDTAYDLLDVIVILTSAGGFLKPVMGIQHLALARRCFDPVDPEAIRIRSFVHRPFPCAKDPSAWDSVMQQPSLLHSFKSLCRISVVYGTTWSVSSGELPEICEHPESSLQRKGRAWDEKNRAPCDESVPLYDVVPDVRLVDYTENVEEQQQQQQQQQQRESKTASAGQGAAVGTGGMAEVNALLRKLHADLEGLKRRATLPLWRSEEPEYHDVMAREFVLTAKRMVKKTDLRGGTKLSMLVRRHETDMACCLEEIKSLTKLSRAYRAVDSSPDPRTP